VAKFINKTKIGEGGFGEVWMCERDTDGRPFAKKIVLPNLPSDAVERFAREVRILGSLDHPNIAKIVAKRLMSERFFYVMPLYRTSLEKELPQVVGDETRIAPILTAILNGVEYAHDQGILHRDLGPRNVLMNSDTDVVISDFGLGRVVDSESTRQTMTGYGMGTMLYMAPEQLHDAKHADQRADIYSLGRIIYELYTGPLVSLHQDVRNLPAAIAYIVTRCIQADPGDRFLSVAKLRSAWEAYRDLALRQAGRETIHDILSAVTSTGAFQGGEAARLAEVLEINREDKDFIHEVLMKLPAQLVRTVWQVDPGGIGPVLGDFIAQAGAQSWGFSYTDTIADHFSQLFSALDDPRLRAAIVTSLLVLGLNHNRWHVLEVFEALFYAMRSEGELAELASAFVHLSRQHRLEAAERLTKAKVTADLWRILTEGNEVVPPEI
jgi:hypothetical protein